MVTRAAAAHSSCTNADHIAGAARPENEKGSRRVNSIASSLNPASSAASSSVTPNEKRFVERQPLDLDAGLDRVTAGLSRDRGNGAEARTSERSAWAKSGVS